MEKTPHPKLFHKISINIWKMWPYHMVKTFITFFSSHGFSGRFLEDRFLYIHVFLNLLKIIILLYTRGVLFWLFRSAIIAGPKLSAAQWF